jgi:uncharacterized protein (DUF1778 family)
MELDIRGHNVHTVGGYDSGVAMPEKSMRVAFRVTERQEALIRAGAASRGMTLTDFVLESACAQAELAILDRTVAVLPSAEFDAWVARLDMPPRDMPNASARLSRLARRDG